MNSHTGKAPQAIGSLVQRELSTKSTEGLIFTTLRSNSHTGEASILCRLLYGEAYLYRLSVKSHILPQYPWIDKFLKILYNGGDNI